MFSRLLRPFRRFRARRAQWSAADDRAFHDGLFDAIPHDPFSPSYVGYVTIRRFADLAGPYLSDRDYVVDLGCGPGEITCELARRFPTIEFLGVDHSAAAIAAARGNVARLGLDNVRFEEADAAAFVPSRPPALVLMFDAFHHLLDPAAFVQRLSAQTDRFFLIEPAGDPLGRWRRVLDFDWLPNELDKIAARIEHNFGVVRRPGSSGAGATIGRAVEHRYPLEDYRAFFRGFSVEARGTVAGFDVYPPLPQHASDWRHALSDTTYGLVTRIDDALLANGRDLYAKHWAIFATRRASELRLPQRSPHPPDIASEPPLVVAGPYDISYENLEDVQTLSADVQTTITLKVTNRSWRAWSSETDPPIHVSYHWLTTAHEPVLYEGLRTNLPGELAPGTATEVAVAVQTPRTPGTYLIEFDLVEEGVSWFSAAGAPPLRVRMIVQPRQRTNQ